MEETKRKGPSFPANYVTLRLLQEQQQIKVKEEKEREEEQRRLQKRNEEEEERERARKQQEEREKAVDKQEQQRRRQRGDPKPKAGPGRWKSARGRNGGGRGGATAAAAPTSTTSSDLAKEANEGETVPRRGEEEAGGPPILRQRDKGPEEGAGRRGGRAGVRQYRRKWKAATGTGRVQDGAPVSDREAQGLTLAVEALTLESGTEGAPVDSEPKPLPRRRGKKGAVQQQHNSGPREEGQAPCLAVGTLVLESGAEGTPKDAQRKALPTRREKGTVRHPSRQKEADQASVNVPEAAASEVAVQFEDAGGVEEGGMKEGGVGAPVRKGRHRATVSGGGYRGGRWGRGRGGGDWRLGRHGPHGMVGDGVVWVRKTSSS